MFLFYFISFYVILVLFFITEFLLVPFIISRIHLTHFLYIYCLINFQLHSCLLFHSLPTQFFIIDFHLHQFLLRFFLIVHFPINLLFFSNFCCIYLLFVCFLPSTFQFTRRLFVKFILIYLLIFSWLTFCFVIDYFLIHFFWFTLSSLSFFLIAFPHFFLRYSRNPCCFPFYFYSAHLFFFQYPFSVFW